MASESTHPVENMDPRLAAIFGAILRETATKIGTDFFDAIVEQLSGSLDCWGAWVTQWVPEANQLKPLAFWANGEHIERGLYPIEGTPCERVIKDVRLHYVPDHAIERYPEDTEMKEKGLCSYIGMPLLDPEKKVLGHIAIMDTGPLIGEDKVSIFELFGERATAEMRRLVVQRQLEEQEEQLRLLFESAMDGILVLDAELKIKALNPAALRTFGCDEAEDMLNESVLGFLSAPSSQKIKSLAEELIRAEPENRCIWIPDKLTAKRWDNSEFPAEASLSCFDVDAECRFALILRDIADVIASEKHLEALLHETEVLRESVKHLAEDVQIIGQCAAMKQLGQDIRRVAQTDASVLIIGETGVGKELVARAVHSLSKRSDRPMVCLNCAALPENLVESELFGHEKGAFTGAASQRIGRFAMADGGTLFLDEIGELSLNAQAKLLRTLQEGIYEPLGSDRSLSVDVRIIVATHRDLSQMVDKGTFREDLWFRLNVFPLSVPPLRDRGDDVILLANAFLKGFARKLGRRVHELAPAKLECLKQHDWPGNVRELQNTIERALIVSTTRDIDLASAMALETSEPSCDAADEEVGIMTDKEVRKMERKNIELALRSANGKISGAGGAAARLGMKPTTLDSKIRSLKIQVSA